MSKPGNDTIESSTLYEQLRVIDSDTAYHPFIRAGVRRAMPEIERLRAVLTEIATGRNADGLIVDFPQDAAAEALGIIPGRWPPEKHP